MFYPRTQKEIDDLKGRTHVELPYILLVGPRLGYKGGDVVQRAFYQARARQLHLFMIGWWASHGTGKGNLEGAPLQRVVELGAVSQ